jgi:hypothetical protein
MEVIGKVKFALITIALLTISGVTGNSNQGSPGGVTPGTHREKMEGH